MILNSSIRSGKNKAAEHCRPELFLGHGTPYERSEYFSLQIQVDRLQNIVQAANLMIKSLLTHWKKKFAIILTEM